MFNAQGPHWSWTTHDDRDRYRHFLSATTVRRALLPTQVFAATLRVNWST